VRFNFGQFVTALHESLQLEEEIGTPAAYLTMPEMPPHPDIAAFLAMYGKNPKSLARSSRGFAPRSGRAGFVPRSGRASAEGVRPRVPQAVFDAARKRGECFRCGDAWKAGHRCAPNAITKHARSRYVNGENPVHIISDLVLCMEGDSTPEEEEDTEDDDAAQMHLANSDRGVSFDEAMNEAQINLANIESVDQEIATNIVSASMDHSGFC